MARYHTTKDGNIPFTPEEEAAWDAKENEWETGKAARIQAENKKSCRFFILSHYSEETQRNAAMGLYTPEVTSAMADHIAAIIAVENATFDLLEASEDPESVPKPVWPEV